MGEGPATSVPRVACPSKRFKTITAHRRHYDNDGIEPTEDGRGADDDQFYGAIEPWPYDGGNEDYYDDREMYGLTLLFRKRIISISLSLCSEEPMVPFGAHALRPGLLPMPPGLLPTLEGATRRDEVDHLP